MNSINMCENEPSMPQTNLNQIKNNRLAANNSTIRNSQIFFKPSRINRPRPQSVAYVDYQPSDYTLNNNSLPQVTLQNMLISDKSSKTHHSGLTNDSGIHTNNSSLVVDQQKSSNIHNPSNYNQINNFKFQRSQSNFSANQLSNYQQNLRTPSTIKPLPLTARNKRPVSVYYDTSANQDFQIFGKTPLDKFIPENGLQKSATIENFGNPTNNNFNQVQAISTMSIYSINEAQNVAISKTKGSKKAKLMRSMSKLNGSFLNLFRRKQDKSGQNDQRRATVAETAKTVPNKNNFAYPRQNQSPLKENSNTNKPTTTTGPTGKILSRNSHDNSLLLQINPGTKINGNRHYGFNVMKSPADEGIYITNIENDSNFTNIMSVGDQILEINGHTCKKMTLLKVIELLCQVENTSSPNLKAMQATSSNLSKNIYIRLLPRPSIQSIPKLTDRLSVSGLEPAYSLASLAKTNLLNTSQTSCQFVRQSTYSPASKNQTIIEEKVEIDNKLDKINLKLENLQNYDLELDKNEENSEGKSSPKEPESDILDQDLPISFDDDEKEDKMSDSNSTMLYEEANQFDL